MDIKTAITHLINRENLGEAEMEAVMRQVMNGDATAAQIGGFLVALRMKGETVDEITGAARVIRKYATRVPTHLDVVDTCGTGGDMRGTFNISTAAALIAAGAGVTIAKHGNRAMSGSVGGADVLEALGVRIELAPEQVAACLEEIGIAFLFAPAFHPAMRHAGPSRRELGIRTIFNLLGPLSNPAAARRQLLGVFGREWLEPLAEALGRLGSQRVMVVHGSDGLDEITLTGTTQVAEWADGRLRKYEIQPADLGFEPCSPDELRGGDLRRNAEIIREILSGARGGAKTNIALLNAAAVIMVAGKAPDLRAGIETARHALQSGMAHEKLEKLIELTNR